ncbi:MAG: MAPEG family protein [Burkholderiaceae bacterium]
MQYVELVAVLAVFQFLLFGALAGRARGKSGLKAPAISGDVGFERMYRVQMNTLELLIAFLPALFLAAKYWPTPWIAGLGAIYLVGRFMYWRAYVSAPSTRGLGFMLSLLPTMLLAAAALLGIVQALFGTSI